MEGVILNILNTVNEFVWGIPALILTLGVGFYISIRTGFVQISLLPKAIRAFVGQFKRRKGSSGVSSYQALCTALAATVGTGNIAGVAGAIAIGGPGSIFWMWICALLGMATKFAEVCLAVFYRKKDNRGNYMGGPMYIIREGMGVRWNWMASIYCIFALIASFGVGNATQINAVIGSINSTLSSFGCHALGYERVLLGAVLGFLIYMILAGGAKRIGAIAEQLIPFAAVAYLILCVIVLVAVRKAIPTVLQSIVYGAFSPRSVTGGLIGSAFTVLRVGASRGVFTNEAGMGTASIAHSSADVKNPVEQGLMGIVEVFLDTIVICTMTALVILCSGVLIPYGHDTGAELTIQAFSKVLGGWAGIPISIALCCFAVGTILGWGLYGARSAQYLFGDSAWKKFVILQSVTAVIGSVMETSTVWTLAEIVNGLMAIPNLIALACLCPCVARLSGGYMAEKGLLRRY